MSARRPQLIQQLFAVVAIVAVLAMSGLATGARAAQDEKITLRVFGPSWLDQLAPQATEEERQRIQKELIDGFLAENPDVEAVAWDAQGPIEEATTRLMTAHLAGEPIDLIACAANPTNGTY